MCDPSQRSRWLTPLLLAAVVGAAIAALMVGSVAIPPGKVLTRCWAVVCGQFSGDATDRILICSRLPRVMLSGAVGAALALAGLGAQTLFRNPLASPYVLGISGGAAVGAVFTILLIGQGQMSFTAVPLFSAIGGLAVAGAVYGLARRGSHFGHALLLAGVAIGALCSSVTAGALYLAGERLQILVFWLMGGLWRASWHDAILMTAVTAAALMILLILAPAMNLALLGERSARDLGVRVDRLQRMLLAVVAVTTAIAVSLTGIIGFIGLIVPHVFRLVVGGDHRRLVPLVAAGGALLLIVADTIARSLAAPAEIPVGILTSIVGAPVFLWLLQRKTSRGPIL